MGVPIITIDVFLALRDYSRAASIEVGIKVGEVAVAAAGIELLRGMLILLSAAARGLSRLPTAAKLAIGAIVVIAVAHPKNRKFMKTVLQSAVKQLSEIALPVLAEVSTKPPMPRGTGSLDGKAQAKYSLLGKDTQRKHICEQSALPRKGL